MKIEKSYAEELFFPSWISDTFCKYLLIAGDT